MDALATARLSALRARRPPAGNLPSSQNQLTPAGDSPSVAVTEQHGPFQSNRRTGGFRRDEFPTLNWQRLCRSRIKPRYLRHAVTSAAAIVRKPLAIRACRNSCTLNNANTSRDRTPFAVRMTAVPPAQVLTRTWGKQDHAGIEVLTFRMLRCPRTDDAPFPWRQFLVDPALGLERMKDHAAAVA